MPETAIKAALDAHELDLAARDPAAPPVVASNRQPAAALPQTDADLTPQPKTSPAASRAPPPGRILIDRETLLNKLSISDATLRRRMAEGVLPRPIEVGGGYCLRWNLSEVEEAIEKLRRSGGADGDHPE
jgi:predicted DNA-binding transcriptional regulator AlpA